MEEGNKSDIACALTRYVREESTQSDEILIFEDPALTMSIFMRDGKLMYWAWNQTEPPDHRGGRAFKTQCDLLLHLARIDEETYISIFNDLASSQIPGDLPGIYVTRHGDWTKIAMCYVVATELNSEKGLELVSEYDELITYIRTQ